MRLDSCNADGTSCGSVCSSSSSSFAPSPAPFLAFSQLSKSPTALSPVHCCSQLTLSLWGKERGDLLFFLSLYAFLMPFHRRLTGVPGRTGNAFSPLLLAKAAYGTPIVRASSPAERCTDSSLPEHPLYGALRARLSDPASPLPCNQVYGKLVNAYSLIEEFNCAKTSRRLARQHAAFRFLRRHNVLLHGLLFYAAHTGTWNTTPEFARLSLLGEAIVRAEVRARLLKVFPDMPHQSYVTCVEELTSRDSVVALFDTLSLEQIVGAKPPAPATDKQAHGAHHSNEERRREARSPKVTLAEDEKYAMLCALVGEMHWFVARTKATDRTHNNAIFPPSDVLILHVLCKHLLECVPAEVLFRRMEPMIHHLRSVWVNQPMSLPSQLYMKPRTARALSLSSSPHAPTQEELRWRTMPDGAALVQLCSPTEARNTAFLRSHMRPKVSHRRFDSWWWDHTDPSDGRGQVLALSPHPAKQAAATSPDATLWNEDRRRELVRPATTTTTTATRTVPATTSKERNRE